ncbi:hypothetical protein [Xanthocytophaga agilis]|nr:hypothetical protein [Xanthocytophaga agilis]
MPLLRIIIWSLLPIWIVSVCVMCRTNTIKRISQWKQELIHIFQRYKTIWNTIPVVYKWILAFSGIWLYSIKFFFFLTTPENHDASWSFWGFVDQGFWVILTYYPDTNNHIFYNLLCLPFSWLLPGQSLWDMTIPNIVIGTATLLWLFCELSRRWNHETALISVIWIASFYESSRYLFQGRGHLLIVSFSLISTFILLSGELVNSKKVYFPLFILSCILGLYTVPTYVLHLFALYVFGVGYAISYKDKVLFMNLVQAGIWICAGTLICYLPVIGVSGLESLIHTGPAHPMAPDMFQRLYPVFIAEWTEYVLGIFLLFKHAFLVAIPIGISILITLFQKRLDQSIRIWLYFIIVIIVVFIIFSLITRIMPEYRVFSFFIWHLHISFVLVAIHWIPRIKHLSMIIGVVTLLLITGTLLYIRAEHLRALHPMHNDLAF